MLRKLSSKDYSNFRYFLQDQGYAYSESKKIFNLCLKHNQTAYVCEERDGIYGVVVVDKEKTITILAYTKGVVKDLLRYFLWHMPSQATITLKKKSYLVNILNNRSFYYNPKKGFGFKYLSNKDDEVTFKYIPQKIEAIPRNIKEED